MVPGHEIVGRVVRVGAGVKKHAVGDIVGVGCLVDSCRECGSCKAGLEQYCERGFVGTYNAVERDGKTPTYGGYSTHVVVDEAFVLRIPGKEKLDAVAPSFAPGSRRSLRCTTGRWPAGAAWVWLDWAASVTWP